MSLVLDYWPFGLFIWPKALRGGPEAMDYSWKRTESLHFHLHTILISFWNHLIYITF
jgi:hypothetical protein